MNDMEIKKQIEQLRMLSGQCLMECPSCFWRTSSDGKKLEYMTKGLLVEILHKRYQKEGTEHLCDDTLAKIGTKGRKLPLYIFGKNSNEASIATLLTAIEDAVICFIGNKCEIPSKINFDSTFCSFLFWLSKFCLSLELLYFCAKNLTEKNQLALYGTKFMYGKWPSHTKELTQEEADFLRKCMWAYPNKMRRENTVLRTGEAINEFLSSHQMSTATWEEDIDRAAIEISRPFAVRIMEKVVEANSAHQKM